MSLMVAALSYNGQFNVGLFGDPKTCPDLAVLAEGLRRSFTELHPVTAAATAS
jgi:WS/DGAT C-terminal domain